MVHTLRELVYFDAHGASDVWAAVFASMYPRGQSEYILSPSATDASIATAEYS